MQLTLCCPTLFGLELSLIHIYRLFLPAKKAEIETVRNGKCDECCVQQKDSDMYEKNYDLCDVHIF